VWFAKTPSGARRKDTSPKKIIRRRHSDLMESTNRSACALQLGARRGVRITCSPLILEQEPKSSREPGVPVTDQEPVAGQDTSDPVGQIAYDLGHERLPGFEVAPAKWSRFSLHRPPKVLDHVRGAVVDIVPARHVWQERVGTSSRLRR